MKTTAKIEKDSGTLHIELPNDFPESGIVETESGATVIWNTRNEDKEGHLTADELDKYLSGTKQIFYINPTTCLECPFCAYDHEDGHLCNFPKSYVNEIFTDGIPKDCPIRNSQVIIKLNDQL
jgi:hypothetical protein